MSEDRRLISSERRQRTLRPITEAVGLPNLAYEDAGFLKYERDVVLAGTWVGLAFTDTIPARPFAQPLEFLGLPLLVVRDRRGELNVFHNVCSHRGVQLVGEPTPLAGLIVCPYHSWSYTTNGELKATPHVGGVDHHQCAGFDASAHGLKTVRSAVYLGILFVNLSGNAPPFERHIAELDRRTATLIGADGPSRLRPGISDAKLSLSVRCNWKLAVENYCEAYHLPWVHPELNAYSTLADHYCFFGSDFAGQGSHSYRGSEIAGAHLPYFEAWPRARLHVAEYPALYPNVLLGFHADHAFAVLLIPEAIDRTREELRIFYVDAGADDDAYRECRAATLRAWRVVFEQDVPAVEKMQIGRGSPGYDGGVFSPVMDTVTHHFHTWVADRLNRANASDVSQPA